MLPAYKEFLGALLTNADTHKQSRYEDGQVPVNKTSAAVIGRCCNDPINGAGYRTAGHYCMRKCSCWGQVKAKNYLQPIRQLGYVR